MKSNQREWWCLVATIVTLAWSVFIFGGAADAYRTAAGVLTAFTGILCLVLLPAGLRRYPTMPWLLVCGVTLLLGFGWFMVLNAVAEHSMVMWEFTAVENRPFDDSPGSVARATSLRSLVELTMVTIGMFAAVRAAESRAWMSLIKVVAVIGGLVTLTGLIHKAAGAQTVWWTNDRPNPSIFAPFYYHGSAGAFLNLCLPLAMGLAFSHAGIPESRSRTTFWGIVSVLIMAGVVASASKGAMIVLALLLPAMLIWNRKRVGVIVRGFFQEKERRKERIALMGMVSLTVMLLLVLGIGFTVQRWESFFERFKDRELVSYDARVDMSKLMIRMAGPEEGSWHGFGPGTYSHLVPHFTANDEGKKVVKGRWYHGHSDPLQTLVEWGWIGGVGWFVVGAGGVLSGLLLLFRRLLDFAETPVLRGMVLALVGVGIHSCADFPLSIYSIHLVAVLLCGICWGLYAERRREMKSAQRKAFEAV